MEIGRKLFATAIVALGAIGLAWGDFANLWQPFPPDMPGYRPLAYLAGVLLVAGGLGTFFDRSRRVAAWVVACVFLCFAIPWAIRVVRYPQLFGTWGGFAEEFAVVVAAVIVAGSVIGQERSSGPDLEKLCVRAFGVCAIAFGLNHFFALGETASMVPGWIPPGQMFWAAATGVFHFAAGVAILSGVLSLLAARLLGCMMLGFSALVWLPGLARAPTDHITWAGNAVNLVLAASAFVVADAIARRRDLQSIGLHSAGGAPTDHVGEAPQQQI